MKIIGIASYILLFIEVPFVQNGSTAPFSSVVSCAPKYLFLKVPNPAEGESGKNCPFFNEQRAKN